MNGAHHRMALAATICSCAAATSASAQTLPWLAYRDSATNRTCDVINAANAELVVAMTTGELVIVSGDDVVLDDSAVDANSFVIFEGQPAGVLGFYTDGDGQRTLWWTSLTGRVIRVNGFTGEPEETDDVPADFDGAPCDACPLWDDPSVCDDPDDEEPPDIIINLCGTSTQVPLGLTAAGLAALAFTRRRTG